MTDLTDDQYRILDRFVRGQEVGEIADKLGLPWLDVRNAINNLANGNRTKARALINQRTPPDPAESPLTAPIVAAKPKPKEAPVKPPGTPIEAEPAPAVAPPNLPSVNIDDLDSMEGVVAAGREHSLHTIRTATAKATSLLADIRNQIIAERQETAVRSRIAELEVELAALRELVPA